MYLIHADKVVEYKAPDEEAREFLRKGDYLYAVFLYSDPQIVLFPLAGSKARIVNDIAHDYTWLPEVPTVILHGSHKSMAMTKGSPLASLCRVGFHPSNKPWTESRSEGEVRQILSKLSGFAKYRRVLFYGATEKQWEGDPRPEIRKRQIALAWRSGIDVLHLKVEVSRDKKVLDFMVENECFASLGMDGDCFSCFRDAELALSMAPTIRITATPEANILVNQWRSSWVIPENAEGAITGTIEDIRRQCEDGSAFGRLSRGKDMVEAAHRRPYFFACLETLTMDPELTLNLVERSLDEPPSSIISSALAASGRTSSSRWNPKSLAATDWNGKPRFAKCEVGAGKRLFTEEWHLGSALEPSKPGPRSPGEPELSLVIPCMGRLAHLRKSMDMLLAQGQEVVVVDWSCPDGCGGWAEGFSGVKVVRVRGQEKFNLSRARNAGAKEASGKKLCFMDCDMVLSTGFSKELMEAMQPGRFATFGESMIGGYSGMTACFAEDFKKVGGYDEKLEGWGWEDTDFKKKLLWLGIEESVVGKDLAWHIPHGDEDRTRFYDEKDKSKSREKNVTSSYRKPRKRALQDREKPVVGTYIARHRDWSGIVRLNEDGILFAGNASRGDEGEWRITIQGDLVLDWSCWYPERISPSGPGKFSSNVLEMEPAPPGSWDPDGVWTVGGGGLGDRICVLSALRTYARANPGKKVFSTDHLLAEVMAVDNVVRLGLGGHKEPHRWFDGPGRNWVDRIMTSMGLRQHDPPLPDLPPVPPWDGLEPGTYAVMQPRGNSVKPDMPDDVLRLLVKECNAAGLKVVVVGGDKTQKFLDGVEYQTGGDRGEGVLKMFRIIAHAKVAMTPNSATAHAAAAYRVPMLAWVPMEREQEIFYPVPGSEIVSPTDKAEDIILAARRVLSGGVQRKCGVVSPDSPFIGTWRVKHRNWEGLLEVRPDGKFYRVPELDGGFWDQDDDVLRLRWDHWGEEKVSLINGKMAGKSLEAEMAPKRQGITSLVAGRLGNQMFQYAYPRIQAENLGLPFRLVVPEVKKKFPEVVEASGEADSYFGISGGPFYHEQAACVYALVKNRSKVRSWFPMPDSGKKFLEDRGNPPVIHVRGGDFLASSWNWRLDGDYYREARKHLTGKPIIVTDDPDHARRLIDDCEVFSRDDDMSIMAHARELVCSYSTYCWWGAFLGDHDLVVVPDKTVLFNAASGELGWKMSPEKPDRLTPPDEVHPGGFVGDWSVSHFQWKDVLKIMPDGTFKRLSINDGGKWIQEREILRLQWDKWNEERVWMKSGRMFGDALKGDKLAWDDEATKFAVLERPMPYVLAGTAAYAEMMTNAVRHLMRQSVPADEIFVIAPDDEAATLFGGSMPCKIIVSSESLAKNEQTYLNGEWGHIVRWKLKAITEFLAASDLIYIDPDVVVFEDIRKFLPSGGWDVCAQRHESFSPCMGILAVKSTDFSRSFLSPPAGTISSDDAYIGSKWKLSNSKLGFLNYKMFPIGRLPLRRPPALCYHYNYTVGIGGKIRRMKADGNWLL